MTPTHIKHCTYINAYLRLFIILCAKEFMMPDKRRVCMWQVKCKAQLHPEDFRMKLKKRPLCFYFYCWEIEELTFYTGFGGSLHFKLSPSQNVFIFIILGVNQCYWFCSVLFVLLCKLSHRHKSSLKFIFTKRRRTKS